LPIAISATTEATPMMMPQPVMHQRTQRHFQRLTEDCHALLGLLVRFAGRRLGHRVGLLLLLVGGDAAIGNANKAVCVSGDVGVVGHHNDRVPLSVQLHQNGHDLLAALAVQRSRRFIG
jgi:hypothetical protein